MFTQTVNIAMNNAFILYNESLVQRRKAYDKKAEYLHEIAYRMSRPWAVEKYQQTNFRHNEVKVMIDMTFRLTTEEKAGAPAMAPAPADAPDVAPAPAQAAAAAPGLGRRYLVPAAVPGATRDVPRQPEPPIPYLGGRWTRNTRIRCSLCPQTYS